MSLRHLRESTYNRVCDVRNLEYILHQKSFEDAYNSSSREDQLTIEAIVEGCLDPSIEVRKDSADLLKEWIREKNSRDISMRDLRELARDAGIAKYSRLNKAGLLSELAKKKDQKNGNSVSTAVRCSNGTLGERIKSIGNSIQQGEI